MLTLALVHAKVASPSGDPIRSMKRETGHGRLEKSTGVYGAGLLDTKDVRGGHRLEAGRGHQADHRPPGDSGGERRGGGV